MHVTCAHNVSVLMRGLSAHCMSQSVCGDHIIANDLQETLAYVRKLSAACPYNVLVDMQEVSSGDKVLPKGHVTDVCRTYSTHPQDIHVPTVDVHRISIERRCHSGVYKVERCMLAFKLPVNTRQTN